MQLISESKDWIDILTGLLTPSVAVFAFILSFTNYLLARQSRKDQLFDRRYAFYKRLESIWLSTGVGAEEDSDPEIDHEDLIPIADEAGFLFGEEISQHIMNLPQSGHRGHPFFPDEFFVAPFRKYLTLEDQKWHQRILAFINERKNN